MKFLYLSLAVVVVAASVAAECGGDVKQESGCDNGCRRNCKNRFLTDAQKYSTCPQVRCVADACQCGGVDNYYFSNRAQRCVLASECPPKAVCGPNAYYTTCGSGCNDRNCENKDSTDVVCPAVCVVGCFCVDGYVKSDDGDCIPRDQCPQ